MESANRSTVLVLTQPRPLAAGPTYRRTFSDGQDTLFADGMPPSLIKPDVISAMREDANSLLPPIFREVVANTESPFLQPIVEYQCEKMVFGRTILIGDAAFTLRPHIGLGVSKAAGDAATLAQAFGDGERIFDYKLETWETARIRFGRAALQRSAALGCYLGRAAQNNKQRELFAHYRQADVVLDGIAAADPHRHLDL